MRYSQKWCDQYMLIQNWVGRSPESTNRVRKFLGPTLCHRPCRDFPDTIRAVPRDTMNDLIGILFRQPLGAQCKAAVESQNHGVKC